MEGKTSPAGVTNIAADYDIIRKALSMICWNINSKHHISVINIDFEMVTVASM